MDRYTYMYFMYIKILAWNMSGQHPKIIVILLIDYVFAGFYTFLMGRYNYM